MRCWQTSAYATNMGVAPASPWIRRESDDFLFPLTGDDHTITSIGIGPDPFWKEQCCFDRMFGVVIVTSLKLRRHLQHIRGGPPEDN